MWGDSGKGRGRKKRNLQILTVRRRRRRVSLCPVGTRMEGMGV